MKTFAREIAWLMIALVLAIPVGYLFGRLLGLQPEGVQTTSIEEVFEMELFLIGAIIGFVCTYLMRVLIWSIMKNLIND
jgi:hypothetical protein